MHAAFSPVVCIIGKHCHHNISFGHSWSRQCSQHWQGGMHSLLDMHGVGNACLTAFASRLDCHGWVKHALQVCKPSAMLVCVRISTCMCMPLPLAIIVPCQKLLMTEHGVTARSAIVTSPTPLLSQWHIHGLQVCGCLCIDEPRIGQQAAAGC